MRVLTFWALSVAMVCLAPPTWMQADDSAGAAGGLSEQERGGAIVPGPVDGIGRPLIRKSGIIRAFPDTAESTPIVFRGRLYRYEWKPPHAHPKDQKDNNYSVIVDYETGEASAPFAHGYNYGSAFVDNDTIYVSATRAGTIQMFSSKDMVKWEEWTAFSRPSSTIPNTSICKAGNIYVMMYECEVGVWFTARFLISKDLRTWKEAPEQCVYDKSRYSAPHVLRYHDGWFYCFFLAGAYGAGFEMHVARSRDLVHWEPSQLNPVLKASPEDLTVAPHARMTPAQAEHVRTHPVTNNSDVDFCYYDGKLILNYLTGDQATFHHLGEAVYEGTLEQFLKGWFPQEPFDPFTFIEE